MDEVQKPGFDFGVLIKEYNQLQAKVYLKIEELAKHMCTSTSPAQFLLIQFQMSQVTQIGDSISNLINQVNRVLTNAVSNQRGQ